MCGGRSWSERGLTLPIWDAIFITSQLLLFGKDWSSKVREVGTRVRSGGGFYFFISLLQVETF